MTLTLISLSHLERYHFEIWFLDNVYCFCKPFIISADSEKLSNLVIKKDKIIQTGFLKFDSNVSGDS